MAYSRDYASLASPINAVDTHTEDPDVDRKRDRAAKRFRRLIKRLKAAETVEKINEVRAIDVSRSGMRHSPPMMMI